MILYTQFLNDVVSDMARTLRGFGHIDAQGVLAVGAERTAGGRYGALAECIGLGFEERPMCEYTYNPRTRRIVGVSPWFMLRNRRLVFQGRRVHYVLKFRFPRFLHHPPLDTVVHELLHIHPAFDGSHRRLRHGKRFDRRVAELCAEWRRKGDPSLVGMMDLDFEGLRMRFGAVACLCFQKKFKTPLRLPCSAGGDPTQLTSARRLGLKPPKGAPRPLAIALDKETDLESSEADLEYRVFFPRGSRRIPAALAAAHPDNMDGADGIGKRTGF